MPPGRAVAVPGASGFTGTGGGGGGAWVGSTIGGGAMTGCAGGAAGICRAPADFPGAVVCVRVAAWPWLAFRVVLWAGAGDAFLALGAALSESIAWSLVLTCAQAGPTMCAASARAMAANGKIRMAASLDRKPGAAKCSDPRWGVPCRFVRVRRNRKKAMGIGAT